QLPFGWVCFSNTGSFRPDGEGNYGLNCLSAGSVSLTARPSTRCRAKAASQLPFGWVCFSNDRVIDDDGKVILSSQLPFGWVCFSNPEQRRAEAGLAQVSIAFRLGLFL